MPPAPVPWTITIDNLETRLRVGIWEHERAAQPVRVCLSIAPAPGGAARAGSACLDQRTLVRWLTEEWPRQAHTALLETRLRELMAFVFGLDARIDWIDAALSKPQACAQARGVGVRMALTRAEHAQAFGAPVSAPLAA